MDSTQERHSRKNVKSCTLCSRPVHAFFEALPYCATHYRSTREKAKNEIIKLLINDVGELIKKNPSVKKHLNLNTYEKAKDFYRGLRENKTEQVQSHKSSRSESTKAPKSEIENVLTRMDVLEGGIKDITNFIKENMSNKKSRR
jgi:hypothetical protein